MSHDNNPYGEFTDKDFKRLSDYIYINYGINLYPNKKVLVKSRLVKRLKELEINSYHDYCTYVLENDPNREEAIEMINRISTNKTEFFREKAHFDFLINGIVPDLTKRKPGKQFKLWSAGCSSGEEPYTIAMVLDNIKLKIPNFKFKIYASDISTNVLIKASTAIYPNSLLPQIPVEFRKRYLLKSKDRNKEVFRISRDIRKNVEFFRYNLLNNKPPFKSGLDIIFCRNTLIYFDRPTQIKVIGMLYNLLNPGGYLLLGHSESLINMDFNMESLKASVYRKKIHNNGK